MRIWPLVASLAPLVLSSCEPAVTVGQPRNPVIAEKNVPATMRDGVILRADIYRPDAPGRHPALLRRTPYSKNSGSSPERFREVSSLGYVVVVQDTRGRYASDGVAVPHDESEDGYDTVEWVASLPYVDGRVTVAAIWPRPSSPPPRWRPRTWWPSRRVPPTRAGTTWSSREALSTCRTASTGTSDRLPTFRRRVAGASFEERDGPIGLTRDERRQLREDWLWRLPLQAVDPPDLAELAPGYFQMLAHPSYDEFWETYDIAARHGSFETPALHVTGWYDTLLEGTLDNFSGLRASARTERAREGQRLIVGPWTHSGPTPASTRIGDVDYGPDAGLDYNGLLLHWYEHWLKDDDSSVMDMAPVQIFVMGRNEWRDEEEWPLSRARPTRLYLRGSGEDGPSRGLLSEIAPEVEPPDRYVYDPADPVPTGAMGGYSRAPSDPAEVGQRPDILVYTSAPLTEHVEVTGHVELVLWASSSAPDTDFTGKLIDVAPDGSARTLTAGILRARYRNGKREPELLTPGEPVVLRIDLLATSNVFLVGHRIRLEVSSSNFPRFDRNANTGAAFATRAEIQAADQTVFHDRERPSYLLLPVVPGR